MGRQDRLGCTRQDQGQAFGVVAAGFDTDRGSLDGPGPTAFAALVHGREQLRQGQEPLIIGPGKPFRRHATDPLAPTDIDLVAAVRVARGVQNFHIAHG
jgi:hypothetical protein